MKKNLFKVMVIGTVMVMVAAGSAFAGRGGNNNGINSTSNSVTVTDRVNGEPPQVPGGRGMGDSEDRGMGHIVVSEGTAFSYTGEIVAVDDIFAIDILTADGQTVTIHGIGPNEYWETLTVARPVIGDTVTITGYSFEVNNTVRNIAFTVTTDGQTVEIRDAEGNPTWRKPLIDVLSGTPFEYSGSVTTAESGFGTPMVITTDAGEEIAVRIGPPMYWESLGATQPVVGDYVTVTGYALTVNDNTIYFAATVKIGDKTVQLLDADGKPLWKQGGKGNGGNGGRGDCVPATE